MNRLVAILATLSPALVGCSTHHWAQVNHSQLPPPPDAAVRHTSRVIVALSPETLEPQCVVDEKKHPVCFFNLRPALERGLLRSLWPSFPEVVVGSFADAGPDDYVLQVDVLLDALPPDETGPGWSAGARGRYRLLRGSRVLLEQTTAARSRAHFAYGAPLGEGATEVVDATVRHIAQSVFEVPESQPDQPALLPRVAAMSFAPPATAQPEASAHGTKAVHPPAAHTVTDAQSESSSNPAPSGAKTLSTF